MYICMCVSDATKDWRYGGGIDNRISERYMCVKGLYLLGADALVGVPAQEAGKEVEGPRVVEPLCVCVFVCLFVCVCVCLCVCMCGS
jgi:hypothetical protein